jgi:hypothetical protein
MPSNWEHFRRAAAILVGPGPVKQRLVDAYARHLRAVDVHTLPAEIHPGFLELTAALSSVRATGGLNSVEATVRKMSEPEAGQHAAAVLEMLVAMASGDNREPAASARQLRLVGGEDDELPAFLNRA